MQIELLNRLFHRDLSNPAHQTNIHLHHQVAYGGPDNASANYEPTSFFSVNPSTNLAAIDPTAHKPLSVRDTLQKRLRWMTLGGQYDWTAKEYPPSLPPPFPPDIANLLRRLFPSIEPQAAILNLYSPGDTLSVHRDVSEACDRDLVSVSIGCDALFIVGNEDGSKTATVRLRSGDAVCMSGPSRFAWHAVPKVFANTCPESLRNWPAMGADGEANFEQWHGWLANKRINLNVRQMAERDSERSGGVLAFDRYRADENGCI